MSTPNGCQDSVTFLCDFFILGKTIVRSAELQHTVDLYYDTWACILKSMLRPNLDKGLIDFTTTVWQAKIIAPVISNRL